MPAELPHKLPFEGCDGTPVASDPAPFPIRAAVVGIGGFAAAHHAAMLHLENAGRAAMAATCDPRAEEFEELRRAYLFRERGVRVYPDLNTLMDAQGHQLDLVTVASPIRFHAGHHRACIERGVACYLEKPPTLDPVELESMIQREKRARLMTEVGFNFIAQPWRRALKERLLAGEFGPLRSVAFRGMWRRSVGYYGRNEWAGRLRLGDYLLLDSCAGNAMSHYVHNMLFHAGLDGLSSWARPEWVEAELYRANEIESADTVFARGVLHNGVEFSLALTHACEEDYCHVETLECENARIEILEEGPGRILWRHETAEFFETGTSLAQTMVRENLARYCGYISGGIARPATTLPDTRPFVHLNALLYVAARNIRHIGEKYAARFMAKGEARETVCVPGIGEVCENFIETGFFPSESGIPWAGGGGRANAGDIARLRPALDAARGYIETGAS